MIKIHAYAVVRKGSKEKVPTRKGFDYEVSKTRINKVRKWLSNRGYELYMHFSEMK